MSSTIILEQNTDVDPNPERLTFLPIDPFAARRETVSRVAGLGGDHPSEVPGYVFQSLEIYPVLGPVRFTLHFHALAATTGTLTVRIYALSVYPGTPRILVKTVMVPMRTVAGNEGLVHVTLISRRNMAYTIEGAIDDETDASATALSLSLDPREREVPQPCAGTPKPPVPVPTVVPVEQLLARPELATMKSPVLVRPVSQAMTDAQARDPLVTAWNAVLHQDEGSVIERWENAFILQALHYYGIATDKGTGLGIARRRDRFPAYLAGRGCTILMAGTHREDLPDGDPGLALEHLVYPDLCPPRQFFEAVHQTLFEDLAIPAHLTGFDFLWSIDAASAPGMRLHFPQMLRASAGCLRPGGVAVHMLRYSGEIGEPGPPESASYGRAAIERMALSLVADGHEVAQLKFDVDMPDQVGDWAIPFGLITRRIR